MNNIKIIGVQKPPKPCPRHLDLTVHGYNGISLYQLEIQCQDCQKFHAWVVEVYNSAKGVDL